MSEPVTSSDWARHILDHEEFKDDICLAVCIERIMQQAINRALSQKPMPPAFRQPRKCPWCPAITDGSSYHDCKFGKSP